MKSFKALSAQLHFLWVHITKYLPPPTLITKTRRQPSVKLLSPKRIQSQFSQQSSSVRVYGASESQQVDWSRNNIYISSLARALFAQSYLDRSLDRNNPACALLLF